MIDEIKNIVFKSMSNKKHSKITDYFHYKNFFICLSFIILFGYNPPKMVGPFRRIIAVITAPGFR